MKSFNREINRIKRRKILLVIIALVIAVLFFIQGIVFLIQKNTVNFEFDKNRKVSGSARATILYIIGPLLEVKDERTGDISEYYIASGKENNLFIIRLKNENIDIPILGKNLKEEEINQLEEIEICGSAQLVSSSLRSTLNNRLNLIMSEGFANNNFDKVFGVYYLDTVIDTEKDVWSLFIIAGIFAIIGICYLFLNKRIRKNVNETINRLNSEGKLNEVIEQFDGGKLIDYKKLNVYLLPDYIFSYGLGIDIIAFKDIKDISASKREIGKTNKYIVITTKENVEYYIAPMKGIKERGIYNELLNKLKTILEEQ